MHEYEEMSSTHAHNNLLHQEGPHHRKNLGVHRYHPHHRRWPRRPSVASHCCVGLHHLQLTQMSMPRQQPARHMLHRVLFNKVCEEHVIFSKAAGK